MDSASVPACPCIQQLRGSESSAIVQRLEDLMLRCREDGHQLSYQDLLQVRHGDREPRVSTVAHHPV